MDILKALKLSGCEVPEDLSKLADMFIGKVKSGSATFHSSGFGGKGLEKLDQERDKAKKLEKKTYTKELGDVADIDEEEEEEGGGGGGGGGNGGGGGAPRPSTGADQEKPLPYKFEARPIGAIQIKEMVTEALSTQNAAAITAAMKAIQEAAIKISASTTGASGTSRTSLANDIAAAITPQKIQAFLTQISQQGLPPSNTLPPYGYEIEINDFPQKARWKITNKETITMLTEDTGTSITTRGLFVPQGKPTPPNERKLHLLVEGESLRIVDHARTEIRRIVTDVTLQVMEREAESQSSGRYSVV